MCPFRVHSDSESVQCILDVSRHGEGHRTIWVQIYVDPEIFCPSGVCCDDVFQPDGFVEFVPGFIISMQDPKVIYYDHEGDVINGVSE